MANVEIDTLSAEGFGKYLETLTKKQEVNDSLNAFTDPEGTNEGIKSSFSLTGVNPNKSFVNAVDVVKNNKTLSDNFVPFISIAAGEAITKGARLFTDFKMPKTIGKGIRLGGVNGLAFMSAVRAYEIGTDIAEGVASEILDKDVELIPGPKTAIGGAATWGTYRAVKSLFKLGKMITENVKIGMVAEYIDNIAQQARHSALGGVGEEMKDLIGVRRPDQIKKAKELTEKAVSSATDDLVIEVKKRIGPEATKQWDDVARRLVNPKVSARVGKYLAKIAPKTAAKLAVSATATAFPEGVSTAFGLGGLAWTAYDVMNLSKDIPDLIPLIFQDTEPEEGIMDEMAKMDAPFDTPNPSPRPTESTIGTAGSLGAGTNMGY